MHAQAVLDHFRSVGHWVDWDRTCDEFLHGDPETEVEGIATGWIATSKLLREAAERSLNLFITHEPIEMPGYAEDPLARLVVDNRKVLMDGLGTVVLRCHDTWDRMPEVGIPDAWAAWLGFETEPRPVESFYRLCVVEGMTVRQVARRVLRRVRSLGQDVVLVLGDQDREVRRMAVGTGAITHLPSMHELGADLLLATDDGLNWWTGGPWAAELELPLLIVNHATSEKPGMMAMADYLSEQFPDVPVEYCDVPFPYQAVCTEPGAGQ